MPWQEHFALCPFSIRDQTSSPRSPRGPRLGALGKRTKDGAITSFLLLRIACLDIAFCSTEPSRTVMTRISGWEWVLSSQTLGSNLEDVGWQLTVPGETHQQPAASSRLFLIQLRSSSSSSNWPWLRRNSLEGWVHWEALFHGSMRLAAVLG